MKFIFWGVRGSIPSPGPRTARYGGNTTCIEVRSDDDTLIIIDGGKGQLHAALPVIRQAGCEAPVISLAKRIEEVFVEGRSDSIILSHHTPELQLLQAIRDEAHRFAITYHRHLRGKRSLVSILDHVEGIGAKRRKALWTAFKTLADMKAASIDELAAVPGGFAVVLADGSRHLDIDAERAYARAVLHVRGEP